jgi:hypothetical protein
MRAVVLAIAILVVGVACGSSKQTVAPTGGPTAIAAPVPAGAGPHFNEELNSVACPTAGNCVVSGYGYTLGRPPSPPQSLFLSQKNGKWSIFTVPLPANLPATAKKSVVSFGSLACPAAGRCVAVGSAHAGTSMDVLILTQHGPHWRVAVLKPPYGAGFGGLDAIACVAVGNCNAIGWFQKSSKAAPKLAFLGEKHGRWEGAWQEKPLPSNLDRSSGVSFGELACTAPGDCVALGSYQDKNYATVGIVLTQRHGVWGRILEPRLPANAGSGGLINLASLSCPSTGNCTIIGGYFDTKRSQQGFALTERNGKWGKAVELPEPANAGPNVQHGDNPEPPLSGLACPSVGDCSATGFYRDVKQNEHPLVLSETAGRWTPTEVVLPADALGGVYPAVIGSLACVSPGNCVALGGYGTGRLSDGTYVGRGLLVVERRGVWATGVPVAVAGSPPGGTAGFGFIACPPKGGSCLAVGTYSEANVDHGELLTVARP